MRRIFFVVMVLFFLALLSQNAYSCSCDQPTQNEEFKNSKVVIIGKFIKRTDNGVEFKVVNSWKGAKVGEIVSLYYLDIDGCGFDVELVEGKEYLLYARSITNEEKPMVYIDCGRSNEVKHAKKDIKKMDKIEAESEK